MARWMIVALVGALLLSIAPARAEDPPAAGPAGDGPDPRDHPLRVMTFNIRYDNKRDGRNRWEFRKWHVASTIRFHRADVCGCQEVMGRQLGDLLHFLPEMEAVATGRDGRAGGERCAILYRKDRFERLGWATLWLSETPDKPSKSWGSSLRRICTWIHLKDKRSQEAFFVFNTHFDHRSATARKQSADLILEKMTQIAGDKPAFLIGDFNCTPTSPPYRVLTTGSTAKEPDKARAVLDGFHASRRGHHGPTATFHGFGGVANHGPRIDYVFTKNMVRVQMHGTVSDGFHTGRTASDHRPVLVDAILNAPPYRGMVDLRGGWRFKHDEKRRGVKAGWHKPGYKDDAWPVLEAGEPVERQGHENIDGIHWFRRTVEIPETWVGKTVHFEVYGFADWLTLYVDGAKIVSLDKSRKVDTYFDRHVTVRLPTALLTPGSTHTLALELTDHRLDGGLTGLPIRLTTEPVRTTDYADAFEEVVLLKRTGWHVNQDANRTQTWELALPGAAGSKGILRFCVGHSADDTGDRGCWWRLLRPDRSEAKAAYARSRGDIWINHEVELGTTWTLVIEDKDTRLGGRQPGNGGSLEARLLHQPGVPK